MRVALSSYSLVGIEAVPANLIADEVRASVMEPGTGRSLRSVKPGTSAPGGPSTPYEGFGEIPCRGELAPARLVTAPVGGITIDGGGQPGDILRLVDGGGATYSRMYILGADVGERRIVTTNNFNPTGPTISQFIRFTGLAAIDDVLTANELTIMGASAPMAGSSGTDLASGRMRLTVGGCRFAAITFANKTKPSVLLAGGQVVTAAVPTVAGPIAAPPVVTVPPPAMAAAQSTIALASVAAADTTAPSVQTGTFPAAAGTPAKVSARPGLAGIRRLGAARRPAVRPIAHNQSKAASAVRRAASYNHLPKGPLGHKLAPKAAARPRSFAG